MNPRIRLGYKGQKYEIVLRNKEGDEFVIAYTNHEHPGEKFINRCVALAQQEIQKIFCRPANPPARDLVIQLEPNYRRRVN